LQSASKPTVVTGISPSHLACKSFFHEMASTTKNSHGNKLIKITSNEGLNHVVQVMMQKKSVTPKTE
jgi:hypothetical protein